MTSSRPAVRAVEGGVEITVRAKPRASRSALLGLREGAFEIRIAAPPVDDAANEELLRLLAKTLGVAKGALAIVHGERSRHKTVRALGMTTDQATARLLPEGPG